MATSKRIAVIQDNITKYQELLDELKQCVAETNDNIESLKSDRQQYIDDVASVLQHHPDYAYAHNLIDDAESAENDVEDECQTLRVLGGEIIKAEKKLKEWKTKLKAAKSKK